MRYLPIGLVVLGFFLFFYGVYGQQSDFLLFGIGSIVVGLVAPIIMSKRHV